MLLFVEIILIIFAWQKGWKALALIPLAIAFGFGFMAGLILGIMKVDITIILLTGLSFDLLSIGCLIYMVKNPRNESLPASSCNVDLGNSELEKKDQVHIA